MDNNKYLVKKLKEAIIAEKTVGAFYKYISERVNNGRVRAKFKKFSDEEVKEHKTVLNKRLEQILGEKFEPDLDKLGVERDVAGYSLLGALRMAKAVEKETVEFYKLAKEKDNEDYKYMYEKLIDDEKRHWMYIDQETAYIGNVKQTKDTIGLKLFSIFKDILK